MARTFASNSYDTQLDAVANPGANPFSIFAWIRNTAGAVTQIAVAKYSGTGDDFWFGVASGTLHFSIKGAGVNGNTLGTTWTPVCATRFGGTKYVWQNGVSISSGADSSTCNPGGTLRIGTFGSSGGFNWTGDIAHVAIWRCGLTDNEIRAMSAGMSPEFIRPDQRVGYWPLDGKGPAESPINGPWQRLPPALPVSSVPAPTQENFRFFQRNYIPAIRRRSLGAYAAPAGTFKPFFANQGGFIGVGVS